MNTIQELIDDIKQGKMIILMDDEDRENEGDLLVASHCITAEIINFMSLHARGLICMTLLPEKCQQLGLDLMVNKNTAQLETNFTVSIDAAVGISTGISAYDRYKTIADAIKVTAKPEDLVVPGHVFPLMAKAGGVLSRAGHTEAGCDMAHLAGLPASSVIVEIMNEDGSMARRDDLLKFAEKHQLKIGTIADLIEFRMQHECTVKETESSSFASQWGEFKVKTFTDTISNSQHLAFYRGTPTEDKPCLVRVQFANFLRELHGLESTDNYWTAQRALQTIGKEGCGVLLVLHANRNTGIESLNTSSHNKQQAYHDVGIGSQILKALHVGKMKVMGPEVRFPALSGFGLEITEFINYPS